MSNSASLLQGKKLSTPSLISAKPMGEQAKSSLANILLAEASREANRKRLMYKNILSYPKGTEHFKYFEKIPHRNRHPQELIDIYEATPKPELNPPILLQQMDFERIKKELAANLSDTDIKIMRLPGGLGEMARETIFKENTIAYNHLQRCLYNYFTSSLATGETAPIQWISYPFAVNYLAAQKTLRDLNNNLFNEKAKNKLIEKLVEAGAFGNERREFYFWNTSPRNWSEMSYQARSVKFSMLSDGIPSLFSLDLPAQYTALGDFTINALPEGSVEPLGNGKYRITVTRMYYFVNDMFNFENWAYLGSWNLNQRFDKPVLTMPTFMTPLFNSDFSAFRRHGYGQYFPVLSRLHEVENFKPQILEYEHAK